MSSAQLEPTTNAIRGKEYTPEPEVKYYNEIVDLIAVDGAFSIGDFPPHFKPVIQALHISGGVEVVGTKRIKRESGIYQVQEYALTDSLLSAMESTDPPVVMPCGHRGLVNNGSAGFCCQHDWCDEHFSREIVEREVFA